MISLSQGRYLHRPTQSQNKRRQTSTLRVGFEPTIPAFERAKIRISCLRPRSRCNRLSEVLCLLFFLLCFSLYVFIAVKSIFTEHKVINIYVYVCVCVLRRQLEEQELVVRQSPASKDVNTEAEEATALVPSPGNDWWRHSRLRRLSTCCSELLSVWLAIAL
jgi:hypothetical protein